MTTIALTSRTICDILAKCIGILRRSYRGERRRTRRVPPPWPNRLQGLGMEERRHTGRVDTAELARCPAAGGCVLWAAAHSRLQTCVRPTLRDAAPLPSQWNVSPGVRGGGWALSATNRAYRLSADMTSPSQAPSPRHLNGASGCRQWLRAYARAPRHTRYLISKSKQRQICTIVPARGHDWPPGTGAAYVRRNAAADVATDATVDGLGNAGGGHVLYHNETMLGKTLKMREAGHGEARHHAEGQGPQGLLWTSRSCSAICSTITDKHSAPAGSDRFY